MVKKSELEQLNKELIEFRQSMNEWILFLNSEERILKEEVRALGKRVRDLELDKIRQKY